MDPVTLAALISTGGGLLTSLIGGAMKGKQTAQEQKRAYQTWQKSRATQFADLEKLTGKRYRTAKDLPAIDPMLKKLLVGRVSQYVSPEQTSKWGIDFPGLLAGFGGGQAARTPMGVAPPSGMPIPMPYRGKRGTPELAEDILNKYQMQ